MVLLAVACSFSNLCLQKLLRLGEQEVLLDAHQYVWRWLTRACRGKDQCMKEESMPWSSKHWDLLRVNGPCCHSVCEEHNKSMVSPSACIA